MEAAVREYNAAHGIVPRVIAPAVLEELRVAGRAVGRELARPEPPAASGHIPQPVYSSPGGNLRASEQIAGELETLEGDELRERTRRMRELLAAANRQQAATKPPPRPEGSKSAQHPTAGVNQQPNGAPRQ